jgi:hypothetical protein
MPSLTRSAVRAAAALAAASSILAAAPSWGAAYHFSVDVPTTVAGGATLLPRQIVRFDGSAYAVAVELPSGVEVLALDRLADGRWLFTPTRPVTLDGVDYEPRDVVAYDGVAYAAHLRGGSAGIPSYARIDALSHDATGALLVSFDVPTRIAGVDYGRSDLVRRSGSSFSLAWSADSAGVPASANLVGADESQAGVLSLAFDIPVSLSGIEGLPGRIVAWNGSAFESRESASAWPASSQMRDFVFEQAWVPPGAVPDGSDVPGVPLTLDKNPGGAVTLRWSAACGAGATDYEVYEGTIGAWWSHVPRACSTAGGTSLALTPSGAGAYYLVVARGAAHEGSYGRDSSGSERPAIASACLPQALGSCP